MIWDDMVAVGRIVRPHGIRGQVVVAPETDFGAERFRVGAEVFALRSGEVVALRINASRSHEGRWVIGFDGTTSMNEAETWRDVPLRVPDDRLPALEANRYYVHELIGCRVETESGERIGEVVRVDLPTGTPLLVVMVGGKEAWVPLAEGICRRIDVAAKVIAIDPPAGLLELNDGHAD